MSHAATADSPDAHHGHAEHPTSTGIPNKKMFMWIFLASDCMFFASLISTHLVYRIYPPEGSPDPRKIFDIALTSGSTFVLLISSLLMALAVNAAHKGDIKSCLRSLMTVIVFGGIFVGCQVYEFWHFVHGMNLTWTNSLFGSTFFVLTGTHGLHVTIGLIWLFSWWVLGKRGRLTKADAADIEAAGLYWHFVDIVWIVIFTAVYLVEFLNPPA